MNKILSFLVSKENVSGMISAATATGLWSFGFLPFLPISLAIGYGIGFLGGKLIKNKPKEIVFYHLEGEGFQDYNGFLNRLCNKSGHLLPPEAHRLLEKIRLSGTEILTYLAKNESQLFNNENIINIKSLFDQHLPRLVNQYVKMPKNYAEKVIVQDNMTSYDLLIKQLKMIYEELNKLSNVVYSQDSQKIIVYDKILEEKIGRSKF